MNRSARGNRPNARLATRSVGADLGKPLRVAAQTGINQGTARSVDADHPCRINLGRIVPCAAPTNSCADDQAEVPWRASPAANSAATRALSASGPTTSQSLPYFMMSMISSRSSA